jgi:hypothetical protein
MTAEQISAVAGVILSLLFSYMPGLKDWFASLDGTYKRLVMIGLMLVVALAAFGLSCGGLGAQFGVSISCTQEGAIGLLLAFVAALVGNQAMFLVSPKAQIEQ